MNKTPVLDNGFVSLFSSSLGEKQIRELIKIIYRGQIDVRGLADIIQIHFYIKSPIFVQLSLGKFGTQITNSRSIQRAHEAYKPSINEVGAKTLEDSKAIQESISQTTDALLLNPDAYQYDGCDIFVSQVITPISVYNTYLASNNLNNWIRFISNKNIPGPIGTYRQVIEDIIKAELPSMKQFIIDEEKKKN